MTATISPCGRYRYRLARSWPLLQALGIASGGRVLFVMLNPSTADAERDDATVRRCVGFVQTWGFVGLDVANLYAWRSTDPAGLLLAEDPVGPDNDAAIVELGRSAAMVVCAWGAGGAASSLVPARAAHVLQLLSDAGVKPHALGFTRSGQPKHPLYLPKSAHPFLL